MTTPLKKPDILNVEAVARSRLFTIEAVDLAFSNGVRRVYERMRPSRSRSGDDCADRRRSSDFDPRIRRGDGILRAGVLERAYRSG